MYLFPSNPQFSFTETCPLPYETYERDVVTLLDFVKNLFSKYFDNVNQFPLKVINVYPHKAFPMTIYEEQAIFLSVSPYNSEGEPGCYWGQFIYQFSHEFCHYMNYGHTVQSMRWFEETLCELASHFFLLESAKEWKIKPPFSGQNSYAQSLLSYEFDVKAGITQFNLEQLSDINSVELLSLQKDEYQRSKNKYVALQLLPLFEATPSLWKIVPELINLPTSNSFAQNLSKLENKSKEDISCIKQLFGFEL